MNNQNIDSQILSTFPTAKKTEKENGDIYYHIDDKTKLYLFTESNNRFKIGILLGTESKPFLTDCISCKDFYIDFQFQNESLIIDDKFPWSSKSSAKEELSSLKEIVEFLEKEWIKCTSVSK